MSMPSPERAGVPVAASDDELDRVKFGPDGLIVVAVQDRVQRDVLMVAYMDKEALRRTLETGRTWFYSRSRREYWQKGETSGDRQYVTEIAYDCDGDALLVTVDQVGRGACHTGNRTCFYRRFGEGA